MNIVSKTNILSYTLLFIGTLYVINILFFMFSILRGGAYAGLSRSILFFYSFVPSVSINVLIISFVIIKEIKINKNIILYTCIGIVVNLICYVFVDFIIWG